MKRVVVTGASGFVGSHVIDALLARGVEVHALGRRRPAAADVVFHRTDLLDAGALTPLLARVQASHLLHLAWYAEPGHYWRSEHNLDWVCASLGLLRAFREAGGGRAVVAGTCAEYAWGPDYLDERTSACVPATLYGAAKDGLRRVAEAYAGTTGLSLGWGRIFFLYGPGEKTGRLVSDGINALLRGERFATALDRQRRDFLHVADVAGAFAALLESGVEGAVNIGSGHAVPIGDLVRAIGAATGRSDLLDIGARAAAQGEPEHIAARVERLTGEVGFTPRFSLDAGLAQSVGWWQENRATGLAGR